MRKSLSPLLLTSSVSLLYYTPYFDSKGIRWKGVANEFSLPTENLGFEKWIPMKDFSLFLNKIAILCEEDMPLIVGQSMARNLIDGKWGFIEKGADLKKIIQTFMLNEHHFSRQNTFWLEQAFGEWCICHRSLIKPSFPGSYISEWFRVALFLHFCRSRLGDDWAPASLNLMTDKKQSRNFGDILLPNTHIRYNQQFMSIELTGVQDLEPMTNRSLKSRDIGEVLLLAESYCHLPHFTLDWLASLFDVTSKTLYRYFKDHETSFKEIKKRAVLKRSQQLLNETDEPISNIAYRMGYEDTSNFNRAIKAMCGNTPAQLRLSYRQKDQA